jgi:hypothetical protein
MRYLLGPKQRLSGSDRASLTGFKTSPPPAPWGPSVLSHAPALSWGCIGEALAT